MRRLVKPSRYGCITIPQDFRDALRLAEGDLLSMTLQDSKLIVEPLHPRPNANWFRELYDVFAPVRESVKDVPEEDINDAIDAAVKEVRSRSALD